MMRAARDLAARLSKRRLISGVTLLGYLVTAIGYPVSGAPAHAANACGQSVCCCGTAEQCKASGCGCPHHHGEPETPAESDEPSCCSSKSKEHEPDGSCCVKKPAAKKPTKQTQPIRWVIGMAAQKCKGGATHWVGAEAALPGPTPIDWQPSWPYCHSLPILEEIPLVHVTHPIDPPPRSPSI